MQKFIVNRALQTSSETLLSPPGNNDKQAALVAILFLEFKTFLRKLTIITTISAMSALSIMFQGCHCPGDLVWDENKHWCVPEKNCSCVADGKSYYEGDTKKQGCNTW